MIKFLLYITLYFSFSVTFAGEDSRPGISIVEWESLEIRDDLGNLTERREGYYDAEGKFVNHGLAEFWHSNSKIKYQEMTYDHGVLDGPHLMWYSNGGRYSSGLMSKGLLTGKHIIYSSDHRNRIEQYYNKNGKLESESYFLNEPGEARDNGGRSKVYNITYKDDEPWLGVKIEVELIDGAAKNVLLRFKNGEIVKREILTTPANEWGIASHQPEALLPEIKIDVEVTPLDDLALIISQVEPRVRISFGDAVNREQLISLQMRKRNDIIAILDYISRINNMSLQILNIEFLLTAKQKPGLGHTKP